MMPIASSNVGDYSTEVFLYKNHEIIIRKPNNSEYYEAFVGDLDNPVKMSFADRQLAMFLAQVEVDSLIESLADT